MRFDTALLRGWGQRSAVRQHQSSVFGRISADTCSLILRDVKLSLDLDWSLWTTSTLQKAKFHVTVCAHWAFLLLLPLEFTWQQHIMETGTKAIFRAYKQLQFCVVPACPLTSPCVSSDVNLPVSRWELIQMLPIDNVRPRRLQPIQLSLILVGNNGHGQIRPTQRTHTWSLCPSELWYESQLEIWTGWWDHQWATKTTTDSAQGGSRVK